VPSHWKDRKAKAESRCRSCYAAAVIHALMMLRNAKRVRVTLRQELLQILFDVVPCPEAGELIEHTQRVVAPVRGLRHRQIVDAADLEEIDELMRRLDQRETRLHIECGLERHPGEDPGVVKLAQRLDPIARSQNRT
jgi:hypothetical protein